MAVTVERVGKRIHADIPYDNGAGSIEAKAVPGARAKFEGKKFICWTYPLDLSTCRDLRRQFGDRLKVGVSLAEWARAQIEVEKSQTALRMQTDATLERVPVVAPALAKAMESRTYQRVAAKFIHDGRSVLVADEPGLGKTLEALAAVVETSCKLVLIFAKKKAVETVWAPEIKRWLGDAAAVHVITGTGPQKMKKLEEFSKQKPDGRIHFVVCNIEMVRWNGLQEKVSINGKVVKPKKPTANFPALFEPTWHAIIVDESHKALIGKSTMSKSITQTRYGMMKLKLAEFGLKIALSGTPFRGKLENLWGTLNWLRPEVFTGYWRFCETFLDVVENMYGGREIGNLRPEKVDDFDKMLAPIMIRRTKGEVAKEMPPRQYGGSPLDPRDPESVVGVWVDMTKSQMAAYRKIVDDGQILLEGGVLNVNGILAELTRRKQFAICNWKLETRPIRRKNEKTGKLETAFVERLVPVKGSSAKFDWIMEKVEELDGASKMVVASQFTAVINAFSEWAAEAGVKSFKITGETTPRKVNEAIAKFNESGDDTPLIFINTMAGGESINLDACADDIVFIDETYIPDDQEQVENRIHRMSRIHHVTVWYLRTRYSVEEGIARITGAREAVCKRSLDGSRGVIYERLIREDY